VFEFSKDLLAIIKLFCPAFWWRT